MQYLLRFVFVALMALASVTAKAQSVGAACTPNGAAAWLAGVPLVCSSLVWAVDTIRIGTSSATCNSGIQGTLRMSGTTLQYCNGTAWTALGGAAGTYAVDRQTFNSSSTWTKPSSGNYTLIECWGAGGSGAKSNGSNNFCGGGGGGGYNWRFIATSSLASTETVTIGAGGAARTTAQGGADGGNTTFGSWVTAYGGSGGLGVTYIYYGGAGGGQLSAASGITSGTPNIFESYVTSQYTGSPGATNDSLFLGGGGGYFTSVVGDASVWGGGGGGNGCSSTNGTGTAGGTSTNGGAGGAGGNGTTSGTAGTQPGGGGGGTWNGTTSGAGGAGRCIVTTF
jgi:hypothetical protein